MPNTGPLVETSSPILPRYRLGKKRMVDYNGASRRYTFNSTGESQNFKFAIMNFQEDSTFKEEHPFISERQVVCREWDCLGHVPKGWTPTIISKIEGDDILMSSTCNRTEQDMCKATDCEKHSTNCTVPAVDYDLWCMGSSCTHCNYTQQSEDECLPCEGSECMNCDEITCYHGYCIQLVEKIASELEFNYTFVRPLDGQWGGYSEINGTGTWNGLVKDLLDKRIDIATVHFSINAQREKYIDFSVPFMQVGLAVVVRAEVDGSNEYFFLQPFDPDVW
eukprot:sb/3467981/